MIGIVALLVPVTLGAALCFWGRFTLAGLILLSALAAVIWAFATSTDTRHPDYAWSWDGGDPQLVFAAATAFFFLPVFFLGGALGTFAYFVRAERGKNGTQIED